MCLQYSQFGSESLLFLNKFWLLETLDKFHYILNFYIFLLIVFKDINKS